jgi:peptidoglycan-N-acetylglucosamine deacetylase
MEFFSRTSKASVDEPLPKTEPVEIKAAFVGESEATETSQKREVKPEVKPVVQAPQEFNNLGSSPKAFQSQVVRNITVPSGRKVIALTFDDGPSEERTNDILYVLNQHNIKATFFVLGQNVQAYPELTKKIVQYGHAIGNHTWNHPYAQQSKASAARQVDRTTDLIYKVTGVKTQLFRPPGGYLNNGLASHAKNKQNAIIMWSVDTSDYRNSATKIKANILKNAKSGGIVLLHDGGGNRWNTLIALPHVIEELKKQGYEFVTIPELLAMGEIQNQKNKQISKNTSP